MFKKIVVGLMCISVVCTACGCNKKDVENTSKTSSLPVSSVINVSSENQSSSESSKIQSVAESSSKQTSSVSKPKEVSSSTIPASSKAVIPASSTTVSTAPVVKRTDFGSMYTKDQLMALDNTSRGYAQGTNVDENNRPTTAMSIQNTYGKYNFNCIMPESKNIYLTFDLGYEYENLTLDILKTLKEKNVKAIFFVTKSYCKNKWHDNTDFVRRILADGQILGNHTLNHKNAPDLSLEEMREELMGMHDYIKTNFNYEMKFYRPPCGQYSERSLALAQSFGYKTLNWSFAYYDYNTSNQPDPVTALDKMVKALHPGGIYLLHAVSETNAKVLGEFIDKARAQGYTFSTDYSV